MYYWDIHHEWNLIKIIVKKHMYSMIPFIWSSRIRRINLCDRNHTGWLLPGDGDTKELSRVKEMFYLLIELLGNWVYICQNSLKWTLKVCAFHCMYTVKEKKKGNVMTFIKTQMRCYVNTEKWQALSIQSRHSNLVVYITGFMD